MLPPLAESNPDCKAPSTSRSQLALISPRETFQILSRPISCPSGHGFSGDQLAEPRQLIVLMLFGFEVTQNQNHHEDNIISEGGFVGDCLAGAARLGREDLFGGGYS